MNQTIRFDRLEKLATFLDTLPKEKFDFGGFWCGSAGCALGWCPVVFKEDWNMLDGMEPRLNGHPTSNAFECADIFFGLNSTQDGHLFMPASQLISKYGGNKLGYNASPSEVAHNIREFIKSQTPETPKREKVKPEIASDLLTFPIQERLDTILSQIKNK